MLTLCLDPLSVVLLDCCFNQLNFVLTRRSAKKYACVKDVRSYILSSDNIFTFHTVTLSDY